MHCKSVGVSVESLIVVKVHSIEGWSDLVSIKVFSWNAVKLNIKLCDMEVLVQSNMNSGFLIDFTGSTFSVLEVENHLLYDCSLVEEGILQLTVRNGAEQMIKRSEIVSTRVVALSIVNIRWPVVEIKVKFLLSILFLISNGEAQLRFIGNSFVKSQRHTTFTLKSVVLFQRSRNHLNI